jgi:hypothetical protein
MKSLIVYFQITIVALCFTYCAKDEETFEYFNIAGTVIDAKTENPIAGAKVYLIKFSKDNSFQWVDESNGEITTIIDSTETDAAGSFSFATKGSSFEVTKSGFVGSSYIDNAALFPIGGDGKVKVALKPF